MIQTDLVEIHNPEPVFQLTWVINNICTNHCRYCPTMLHSGSNHHYEWHHVERFAQAVMERYPRIQVSIAGGEPTVSPWLKDLVNLFLKQGHVVSITSNGVRRGHYWDDCQPDYLCLSYHAAFEDDQWLVRAIETQRRVPWTTARIMMDPDRWDQCVRVYETLKTTNLGVESVKILDWGKTTERVYYTEAQLEWLGANGFYMRPRPYDASRPLTPGTARYLDGRTDATDNAWANQLINQNRNYFTGWQCDIGLESLFVHFNGSYRRGNCSQGGYLGWIQDPVLTWPTEPVICELAHCHCTTDITVSKRLIPIRKI